MKMSPRRTKRPPQRFDLDEQLVRTRLLGLVRRLDGQLLRAAIISDGYMSHGRPSDLVFVPVTPLWRSYVRFPVTCFEIRDRGQRRARALPTTRKGGRPHLAPPAWARL